MLSTLTLTGGVYAPSADAAANRPEPAAAVTSQLTAYLPAALEASRYTVRSGDNLADLALRFCGRYNDWTGLYEQNRSVVGSNPNLILPGQSLTIGKCTDPPRLLRLGSVQPRTHATFHRGSGRVWGVTYGYPNRRGDGDGDGWDVSGGAVATPARHNATVPVYHAAYSTSGIYSYSALEALWMAAGGPAWAAAHAASIAECESGGRVNAYNPSGATGLFQILGAVVPGNLYNPYVNALNAVAKFRASGDTFSQWVCR
jgi:hypothetical protein